MTRQQKRKLFRPQRGKKRNRHFSHLAATARRFLALAAPGSTDRDLAASRSLLDAMEMFFRFPMTWIWSSLLYKKKKEKQLLVSRYTVDDLSWNYILAPESLLRFFFPRSNTAVNCLGGRENEDPRRQKLISEPPQCFWEAVLVSLAVRRCYHTRSLQSLLASSAT